MVKYFFSILVIPLLTLPAFAAIQPTDGELEQEVARNTALLRQDGDNAKLLNDLGFAYYRLHRIPEAMAAFTKSITADPSCPTAYNNLGAAYLHLKDYARAESAFSKALALDPHFVKAAYNLSVSLYRQQKYLAAYKAYQRAKKIDADYVKKRFNDAHTKEELHEELKKDPHNGSLQAIVDGADKEK